MQHEARPEVKFSLSDKRGLSTQPKMAQCNLLHGRGVEMLQLLPQLPFIKDFALLVNRGTCLP